MRKIISNLSNELQKLKENAIKEAWSFKSKSKNLPEKSEENTANAKETSEKKFQNFSEIQKFFSPAPKKKRPPSLLEAITKNSDNLIIILLIILLMDDKENFPLLLVLLYLMI